MVSFKIDTPKADTPNPEGKNPFKSLTLWGLFILLLEVGEILSGDPLSLNGAFKVAGFFLCGTGSALVAWGRWRATQPLGWP